MNIGIDIDNVISKFDEALGEELRPFYLDNVERIAKNLEVI